MSDVLPRALAFLVALALLLGTATALQDALGPALARGAVLRPVLQLLVLSAAWLLVNSPVEGRVLWVPLPRHGLTQADMLAVPPLLVAGLLAVLRLRG